jgi:hypothetical protein
MNADPSPPVAAPPASAPVQRCIGFELDPSLPVLLLAPGTLVEQLVDVAETPLPGAPLALSRIVSLRGALLPVFDLRAWLGLPAHPRANCLAIGQGDRAGCVLCATEPRVVDVVAAAADGGDAGVPSTLAPFVQVSRDASGATVWRFDHEAWFAVAARSSSPSNITAPGAVEVTP